MAALIAQIVIVRFLYSHIQCISNTYYNLLIYESIINSN